MDIVHLEQVMAGSGHLQTFRLLRFLRGRNSTDGHASYGIQMAVSISISYHEILCIYEVVDSLMISLEHIKKLRFCVQLPNHVIYIGRNR